MSKNMPNLKHRKNEKSFQSSTNGSREDNKKIHAPLPATHLLATLGFIVLILSALIVMEKQLPVGLKKADEARFPQRFIAERAHNYLRELTSIGPRVAGSHANEVLAVQFLKKEIGEIMKNAHENVVMEMDVQTVSGDFQLAFLDGMTNVYRGLQNVIVKVGSKIQSQDSLLINCHFDSVMESPGASDDGAACAVMLESLRVISKSGRILRHNIIFLFNGGEENFLPASHGFITQHKWAKEVRAFINLEACGAGGKEHLFQAGPEHPWILETYSEEVPYPFASSLAQEIFQSGAIPGDTDFRIFRDFGNLSGVDFAWSANGYVYHTKYDNIDQIPLGTLQRTGDNILALAQGMAHGHQLSNTQQNREGQLVFFDILGIFVFRTPMAFSDFLHIASVMVSIFIVYSNMYDCTSELTKKRYATKLLQNIGAVLLTWVISVATSLIVALLLNAFGRTMSWYGKPLWVFFLYVIPTILVSMVTLLLHAKYYHKDIDVWPWTVFQTYYDAYQILWSVLLALGTIVRLRSSFIAFIWVLFPTIGNCYKTLLFRKWRGGKWLLLHVGAITIPFAQSCYLIIMILYLFLPVMGRVGAGPNSEVIIGVMVSFLFALLSSFINPLILLVRDTYRVINLLFGLFLLSFAVLLLTPLGFPYSGDPASLTPQRFMVSHTKRVFHDYSGAIVNESSGYWIVDCDMNSPHSVDRYVPEMVNAISTEADCADHLFCGLPYLVPVLGMYWKTHWLPGPKPILEKPTRFNMLLKEKTDVGMKLNFTLEGPHHMAVMFSPVKEVELYDWSLTSPPLVTKIPWQGRKTYFIFYSCGLEQVPFNLTLEFKVPKDHAGPIVDLAVQGQYIFGQSKSSPSLKNFIRQFPPWTTSTFWSASYESWIL